MIKMNLSLSKTIAFVSIFSFALVLFQKEAYASQVIQTFNNEDLQVTISQEKANTVIVTSEMLKDGIENAAIHVSETAQIEHISDEAGNEYEFESNRIEVIPTQKLLITFNKEAADDFIEFVSYNKGGKAYEIRSDIQSESSSSASVESSSEGAVTETSQETTAEMTTSDQQNTQSSTSQDPAEMTESELPQLKSTRALGGGSSVIPEGGILINGLFASPAGGNGFSIRNIDPDDSINRGQPYSEITIGGSNNWISMWSLENNLLNFSHSFKGRMYVNFGSSQTDGFTFTIHNDPSKTTAITGAQNSKTDGQNLGVYGSNVASRYDYPNTLAIKNSFTVEFDMYQNGASRYPSAFDVAPLHNILGDIAVPHMAYTFPGSLAKTYQAIDRSLTGKITDVDSWFTTLGSGRAARIKHQQLAYLNTSVADNVQDSKWYEFNFSFEESTKDFQYFLRNPVTGNQTPTIHVPWSDLSSELNLTNNNLSAYWGFTAANGVNAGNVKVVFAEAPVELNYDLSNHIFNEAGTEITVPFDEASKALFAKKGETVKLETDIKLSQIDYTSSNPIFQGIVDPALLDLSTLEKTKLTINGVYKGDLIPTINYTTGQFSLLLPASVKKGDEIKLSTAAKSKINAPIDDKTSFFTILMLKNPSDGSMDYLASDPGYFWLKHVSSPLNVSWSKDEVVTTLEDSSDRAALKEEGIDLTFYYDGGTANSTIDYLLKKQDQTIVASSLQNDGDITSKKDQGLTIPLTAIDYGSNELNLELSEKGTDGETQTLKFTLNVTGSLQLVAAPAALKWTDRTIGTTKGISERDTDNVIDLAVQDSRQGTPDDWFVSINMVKSSEASSFSKVDLVWKDLTDVTTKIPAAETASSLKIMNKQTATTQSEYTSNMHLANNQGVLLDSKEYLPIGNYDEMKVQWLLQQTYQPG